MFESHFNLFRESDPAVQELKTFCWNQLLGLIGRLNRYDLPTVQRLQIYSDSWLHVTRRGGYLRPAQSPERLVERRATVSIRASPTPTRRTAAC